MDREREAVIDQLADLNDAGGDILDDFEPAFQEPDDALCAVSDDTVLEECTDAIDRDGNLLFQPKPHLNPTATTMHQSGVDDHGDSCRSML